MKLGDRIKELREKNGISQQELYLALNVEQSTLANYESNRRVPKPEIILAIANYFHVSTDYLLGKSDNISNNKEKIPADLKKYLDRSEVMFDGETYNLTPEEKEMVMQSLKVAFYAAKRANKRKKDGPKK